MADTDLGPLMSSNTTPDVSSPVAGVSFASPQPNDPVEPPHNLSDISQRATKYDFALGDKSPGTEELINRLQNNFEDGDRQKFAIDKTLEQANLKTSMIKEMATQAASEGRPLTAAETQAVLDLSSTDISTMKMAGAADKVPGTVIGPDPTTIFEREYARKVIANALQTGEDTPFTSALYQNPDGTQNKLDVFEDLTTYKESYQKLAEEIDAQVNNQSTLGYSVDFAKGFVPGYTWLKTHNALSNTPGSPLLPGNNIAQQIVDAYSGQPEDTIPGVFTAVRNMAKDNPQLAQVMAHSLLSYPSASKMMDNLLIAGGDFATIFPFGLASKALRGAVKIAPEIASKASIQVAKNATVDAAGRFNKVVSDIASTVMKKNVTIPEVLDSAGQVIPSAATSIVDKFRVIDDVIQRYGANISSDVGARDLVNEVPGFMNAPEIIDGVRSTWATKITSESLQTLTDQFNTGVQKMFSDILKTAKAGPEAIKMATSLASNTFKMERRDLEHSIMNVFENNIEGGLGDHQALIHLGDESAQPFTSMEHAYNTAKLYGLEGTAKEVPAGTGWALQIQRPLDFTAKPVRDAMRVDAKNMPSPFMNQLGRWLVSARSGEDVMPPDILQRMKIATYGGSGLEQTIMSMAKQIGKVRDNKDFLSFLKSEAMETNKLNPEKLGNFSDSPGEFQLKFTTKLNRLPTEAEQLAYFTYKNINDLHYMGMNLGIYLDKNAIGLSNFTLAGIPAKVEGKVVSLSDLLKVQPNAKIMVLEEGRDPQFMYRNYLHMKGIGEKLNGNAKLDELVNQKGYVLTQISDTGDAAIRSSGLLKETDAKAGAGRINFVVSRSAKAEPLSLKQVPYVGGAHQIMDDGHYISQPEVYLSKDGRTATYYGDKNIAYVRGEKIGKDVVTKLEKFRQDYKAFKKMDKTDPAYMLTLNTLKATAKKDLPFTFSQLVKDFGKDGYLDINNPIMLRQSNQSLSHAHQLGEIHPNAEFVRHADSELNLYRGHVNLDFATARGDPIREVVDRGDPSAPLYGMRAAKLLDPMASVDRGVAAMVRGRYFEPYKKEIADRFLSEYGDLLDPTNKQQMLDPFRAMKELEFRKNLQGTDVERQRQAMAYAARANQFFGSAVSQEQKYWDYVMQKLIGEQDPSAMGAFRSTMADILQGAAKDPVNTFKKLAFYPKMGMWNFVQILKQGNTFANVIALAGPTVGTKAGLFSMLHNFVMRDAEHLTEQGAKIVERMGFDPQEFIKVTKALDRTGFGMMGREVATREQHLNARVVQTKIGALLDHGLYFMKQGEEFVRRAAFNAAYMEKLAERGGKELTDRDIAQVINRADFMNVNMSHASNAVWQSGAWSIPTQFWSYQVRLFEQLAGKRMTTGEKASLLGTYSLLYGVPVTAGAVMPFWPAHESIKEYLIGQNIDTNDNLIVKALNDGILSGMGELLGGEDTNIESVYGPGGNGILKDMYDGRKGMIDVIGGASGNVFFNLLSATVPAAKWIGMGLAGYDRPPLTAGDFADALSNISIVNTGMKVFSAIRMNAYLTKYGETLGTDDSTVRMVINDILGIQPQAIDDYYRTMQHNENYKQYMSQLGKSIKQDIRNGLNSTSDKDKETFMTRANAKTQLVDDPRIINRLWADVFTENKDAIERSREMHSKESPEAREFENNRRDRLEQKGTTR